MNRRACAPSSDDLTFFFDPWHAPLAEAARTLAMEDWPEEQEDAHAVAKRLAEAGLLRACVPASVGGLPARDPDAIDVRAVCLVREALGWGSGLLDTVFAMQGLGSYPIVLAGTVAQQEEYLPAVLRGESLAAFAITEPEAGTDVSSLKRQASKAMVPIGWSAIMGIDPLKTKPGSLGRTRKAVIPRRPFEGSALANTT